MIQAFEKEWVSLFPKPFYTHELAGYGKSYFETLWKQMGLDIYYHRFSSK
jgi:hypothetical protein